MILQVATSTTGIGISKSITMTSSDYSWLQLPTSTQWEELAFDSTYNSQGSSLSSPTYDNALYTGTLNTPPSLSTTPPTPNNSTTQNPISQRSYRQRRTPHPRSESSTTGSTYQGNSHGPISVCLLHRFPPSHPTIHTNPPSNVPSPKTAPPNTPSANAALNISKPSNPASQVSKSSSTLLKS